MSHLIAPDELILVPPSLEVETAIPIDQAADAACKQLALPLLGGPSGRGWSYFSLAEACPFLWKETYGSHDQKDGRERTKPTPELQIGGLFHLLLALYYAYGLDGEGAAFHRRRGLLAPHLVEKLPQRGPKPKRRVRIPSDAADRLLGHLKELADLHAALASVIPEARPALTVILEAERIFDAHTNFYGEGQEDLVPLAVEWLGEDSQLGYTCRYDLIARLGASDPFVRSGQLDEGAVVVVEHKSARWLNDWARESWFLDGEILGQALCWGPSQLDRLFGPLAGILVSVTTKEKVPKFERILVSKKPAATDAFAKLIRWQKSEIALWRATDYFPRRLVSCWRFGKPCGLLPKCRGETAAEALLVPDEED